MTSEMPITDQTSPAMMPPPLPGRADFPGAYQQSSSGAMQSPAGDYRTYNEPIPVSGPALKAADLKAAENAVAAAMRFQGQRAFAEDVAKGIAPEKAILTHGPKMFFNSPNSYNSALKLSMAHTLPPFVPTESTLPSGARYAYESPNRVHFFGDAASESKQNAAYRTWRLSRIGKELDKIELRPASVHYQENLAKKQALEAEAEALAGGKKTAAAAPQTGGGIRVRRKSDGKVFRYPGDGADVPTEKYELLMQ